MYTIMHSCNRQISRLSILIMDVLQHSGINQLKGPNFRLKFSFA